MGFLAAVIFEVFVVVVVVIVVVGVVAPGAVVAAAHQGALALVVRVAVALALLAETGNALAAASPPRSFVARTCNFLSTKLFV